ncbi:MAG: sulfotransferase [Anaerolineae bacterium]|jgi:hypothetical protein
MDRQVITIVSGLPRSGTSMMMKMLEAGGMPLLTDGIRTPDEDNPKGYYEFERVKQIEHDRAWLEDARGKAVKMIAALLKHLPPQYQYEVIFMKRNVAEVLASQRRMLDRRGEAADTVPDERMAELFEKHVEQVEDWLAKQLNIAVLYVDHGDVLQDPRGEAQRISDFLSCTLHPQDMAAVVDRSLYRQRQ